MLLLGSPTVYPEHFQVYDTEIYTTPSKEKAEKQRRIVRMNVSAYTKSSDECSKGDGVTASGIVGTPFKTCASDVLPFGTKVIVNGKTWVVQDRFGGGYSNRLDLMMCTKEQCFNFGRQWLDVEIIED